MVEGGGARAGEGRREKGGGKVGGKEGVGRYRFKDHE